MKPASDPYNSTLKCAVEKDGIASPRLVGARNDRNRCTFK